MVNAITKALARCCAIGLLCLLSIGIASAQVNVTTYHYDNYRTGWNQNETTLTQSNVNSSSFGLLETVTVDDQVDAQPLLVNGLTINGSQHNVLYVATENNSVYAIDSQSGQVLLQTNLGTPVYYPLGCNNNGPDVGIDSTPVIDTNSSTLYVIAYIVQYNTPEYYLHALSLTTLADTITPVLISASGTLDNGTTFQFNPEMQRQRPALLLANSAIYAGFGSFCDYAPDSRGWVLGWQESSLTPLSANRLNDKLATSPDDFFLSSVWMSGYGLAANNSGSVFFVTGNSDYSGTTYSKKKNISESAAEVSSDLTTMQSLFTPTNHANLDENDGDFGSGGLLLLPPQGGKFPDLAAAAGKDGNLYLLDADKLSREYNSYQIGNCWCGPSYYQASDGTSRIVTSGGTYNSYGSVGVWKLSQKGRPALTSVSQYNGIAGNGTNDPGFFTSVSSNGTTSGTDIVWAVGRPTDNDPAYVDLYAINPDTGALLFSEVAGQWLNTSGNSNIVPVVSNGFVYVASDQMVTIFGLGGSKKVNLPPIRHMAARPPLKSGEHEIYGTVVSMNGSSIIARKRAGETVRIDATDAKANSRFAEPAVGRALAAIGTFDRSGVFQAEMIQHAKSRPATWPADR